MKLKIIIGSTRPSRKGPIMAHWLADFAKQNSDFEVEVLDLKEINLPFMDEIEHPMLGKYQNPHTLKWSKAIDEADAFVFATPEYNYSFPATLKNAIDYLHKEWKEKPAGFLSYGGVSGGTRAVQQLKMPLTTLSVVPLTQAVNIPFYWNFIDENNQFKPNEVTEKAAETMLDKLYQWAEALKGMREKQKEYA